MAAKQTQAQRLDTMEQGLGAIMAHLGIGEDGEAEAPRSRKQSTAGKGRRVQVPQEAVEIDGAEVSFTQAYQSNGGTAYKVPRLHVAIDNRKQTGSLHPSVVLAIRELSDAEVDNLLTDARS